MSGLRGPRLEDLVAAAAAEVDRTGLELCDAFVASGERFTRQNTPVETSALRESWDVTDAVPFRRGWTALLFNPTEYAEYVEEGTGLWGPRRKKYKIAPKDPNGMLAFRPYLRGADGSVAINLEGGPAKGGTTFARFVMHPGSPGHHMMRIGKAMAEHDEPQWSEKPLRDSARRMEAAMKRVAAKGRGRARA